MTGWPWPIDGVQGWFEGFWNSILESVYAVANQVWAVLPDWIKGPIEFLGKLASDVGTALINFFLDPIGTLQAAFNWIVQQITNGITAVQGVLGELGTIIYNALPKPLRDFADTIGAIGTAIWTGLNDFIKDPVGTIQSGLNGVVSGIASFLTQLQQAVAGVAQSVWNALPDWVQNGLLGLAQIAMNIGTGFLNFIKDPVGTLSNGWNWIVSSVSEAAGAIKAGVEAFVGDVLKGAMMAIGDGLRGFFDWLLKSLMWLGQMIMGAVNAVVGAIGGFFTSMINGFINAITGAFGAGSPDEETATACNVMVQTLWDRQLEIIQESYPKSPTPQTIQQTALAVMAGLLTVSVTSLGLAGAAEMVHPIKQIFAHRTVREILWMVGVPAVMASIITLPSAVGLLTPLRYALQEQFQPMIPTAADLVRMELREVFRPAFRAEQLRPPPSGDFIGYMAKLGYNRFHAESYWAAHWVLPSITQLNEMLHRNIIDYDTWSTFVRRNDYLPVMIPDLAQIIYSPYTRVDIRRMYDVRVLDEGEMVGAYQDIGYDNERAKRLALFSKIYVLLPDLRARYRNAWISRDELLTEIKATGLVDWRANEVWETIVKGEGGERTTRERALTKSEIVKGVKAEILTAQEGVWLLMDMGYEEWEALYILELAGIIFVGHPQGYWEMRRVTELYKRSQGKEYQEVPGEVIETEKAFREAKVNLKKAQELNLSEKEIGEFAVKVSHAESAMRLVLSKHKLRKRPL